MGAVQGTFTKENNIPEIHKGIFSFNKHVYTDNRKLNYPNSVCDVTILFLIPEISAVFQELRFLLKWEE
uniref:hypothetical protein n=1 Tax=Methanosarcina horonobensis TaxID=418008 RepID=UPI0022B90472|nr:hypothetical protein [Methanosarcina horonobensis]